MKKEQLAAFKRLVKAPKGDAMLAAGPAPGGRVAFTNAHWLVIVDPADLPPELRGFLPTASEPNGYRWDANGRNDSSPNIAGVLPYREGQPVRITRWSYDHAGFVPVTLARIGGDQPMFINAEYLATLAAFAGPFATFDAADQTSAVAARVDGALVALVMPIRSNAEWFADFAAAASTACYREPAAAVAGG